MARKIVMMATADLRPHPLNKELYGPPTANEKYEDIKFAMKRAGFDERHTLLVTEDHRIIAGVTRWAAAKSVGITEVPVEVFVPADPATAELDIEAKLITENGYRVKTRLMVAREQQKLVEVEQQLARRRMSAGSDGGASRSTDRAAVAFKTSGKTIQRNLRVLAAIDQAQAAGDRKTADRLTEMLEHGKTGKALDLITGKTGGKPKPVAKVDVPRTLNDHSARAYSEFYEACAKARVAPELDILRATIGRMQEALDAKERRLEE